MADITMPQLGETVTEGTIIKWHKSVGDEVAEDEVLFEVSTDKVDSEVPSSVSGYLNEILVPEGETVDVGTKLAVIGDQSASGAAEPSAPLAEKPASGDAESTDGAADGEGEPGAAAAAPPDGGEAAVAEAAAASDGRNGDSPEPVEPAPPPVAGSKPSKGQSAGAGSRAPAAAPGKGGSKLLSPVVRKLLSEHELDPAQIDGTGQGGRITRADVLAVIDKGATADPPPAPKKTAAEAPAAAGAGRAGAARQPQSAAEGNDEIVAFSNIRRRTAEHMVRSQATAAHVLTAIEVDFDGVDRARGQVRSEFKAKEGFSLTYLPFVARAVVDAIAEFPHVNASVGDNQLVIHRRINLGIAVDLSFEGLIVPVIKDADGQRLRGLARSAADLARKARSRELTADDISGGTFTITNPGPFGTFLTAPVINQPQVAILSTDGVKKRPVAIPLPDGSDAIAVHPVGNLALSFDHRAFDGAYAAAFIARCKEILETRDWAVEL